MDTIRCKDFHELALADFVFPIKGEGYIKLYEREDPHTYSVEEINAILDTEWWYYILTPWEEFLFFGTRLSGQKRNVDAEVYNKLGHMEFYGNILSAYVDHVDYTTLLKCKLNLQWREYVLQRNHDVFYPVASNKKSRELTPAKGMFYGLKELQKLVGGYIELIPVDNDHYVVCHEEELLKRHTAKGVVFNNKASVLTQTPIFGPALLIKKTRLAV